MSIPVDQLFATSILTIFVPESSSEFPPRKSTDEWLNVVKVESTERRQAFFGEQVRFYVVCVQLKITDEQLQSLLLLRIRHLEAEPFTDASTPPDSIIDFLGHVQVSLEASYISPVPTAPAMTPRTSSLLATPRTGALAKPARLTPHPSILPPSTPNPTPATGDNDRAYMNSEGTPLLARVWGANDTDDNPEDFTLLWSEAEKSWIAVYRIVFTVSKLSVISCDWLLRKSSFSQAQLQRSTSLFDHLGHFKGKTTSANP